MAKAKTPSAQRSAAVPRKKPPTGRPFAKGADPRRNPGGVPREARELRQLLRLDADEIHAALMKLVRQGNTTCTIYAHRQLVGEPPQSLEISGPAGGPISTTIDLTKLPDAKLKQLDQLLEEAAATDPTKSR